MDPFWNAGAPNLRLGPCVGTSEVRKPCNHLAPHLRNHNDRPLLRLRPRFGGRSESIAAARRTHETRHPQFADIQGQAVGSAMRPARTGQMPRCLGDRDVLVVWRLDRLGKSMRHLITIVEDLRDRGIGFRSLQEGAIDTTSAADWNFGATRKAFAYAARATQSSRSVSIRVNLWPLSKGRPVAARARTATDEHGVAQIMTDRH